MRTILLSVLWIATFDGAFAQDKVPAEPKSVVQITAASRPSIVTVMQIGRREEREALGTGFVIREDGLIATNMHVIGNARRIKVQLSDGSVHDVKTVYATDPNLDLALIQIDRKNLTPLSLGDSANVKQGQNVVVLGHPQGLEYSVVEGVVSALRKVDDATMIQIAMPIEEGNSGGPLLDLQGNVQGIITLKSAVTENLGFAHPINDLKKLIESPNPVPMSRWLTIGRLDTKTWDTVMGARWTQHGGMIHVEELGEGWGGRSLCLNKSEDLGLPFEASVQVKLSDEAGAAGLAFCANGQDQHYGFYPSGGNLRLVRFNGPDIFSWKILSEIPSDVYKRGGWNTLRIRVDETSIQCFVNDQLVITQQDAELRGGYAGLCKFRQTKASFKGFQQGTDLRRQEIPRQLAEELQNEFNSFLKTPTQKDKTMEKLLAQPAAARRLLDDKVRLLEEQAASLRKLEGEVHRKAIAKEIAQLLKVPDDQTELMRAALLIASHDNPDIDIEGYLRVIGRMAEELKSDPAMNQGVAKATKRISNYLFEENGFHGSRSDEIDNFSNSYLSEVIDDREGIPITLSIVYLELTRRLGLPDVYGVSLPGRFMVAYEETFADEKFPVFIDVFNGGKLLRQDEAERFIFQTTGQAVQEEQRQPATPKAMIMRLLYNLASFSKKPEQAMPYLDLILELDPEAIPERLNRALSRMKTGDVSGAKQDLEVLLQLNPREMDMQRISDLYHSL